MPRIVPAMARPWSSRVAAEEGGSLSEMVMDLLSLGDIPRALNEAESRESAAIGSLDPKKLLKFHLLQALHSAESITVKADTED